MSRGLGCCASLNVQICFWKLRAKAPNVAVHSEVEPLFRSNGGGPGCPIGGCRAESLFFKWNILYLHQIRVERNHHGHCIFSSALHEIDLVLRKVLA